MKAICDIRLSTLCCVRSSLTCNGSYVNKINRGKRLEYARIHRDKPLGYWNDVIWSDESKFNLSR